jgi:hypothetical protein
LVPIILEGRSYDPVIGFGAVGTYYVIEKVSVPFRNDGLWYDGPTSINTFISGDAYLCVNVTGPTASYTGTTGPAFLIPTFAVSKILKWQ